MIGSEIVSSQEFWIGNVGQVTPNNSQQAVVNDLTAAPVITLKNGLRLVVKERPETRTAALQVWVRVGSRDEREGQLGISHLLAHMILKGTEDLPAAELARRVASLGGRIGGGTSQEYSQYYAEVPDTNYREMLRLLLKMITRPALREEDLAKERQVVLTEIGRLKDIPESSVDELALREVFKGHPLGNPIRGEADNLKKITRDALMAHYQSYYLPTHMVIVIAGNVKTEEVREVINEEGEWKYGELEKSEDNMRSPTFPSFPEYPEQFQLREISLESIFLQQAKILLAIRVMGMRDVDRPAMEVLASMIQLRLFDSIRETHGLAYVVNSDYIPLSDTGVWKIYIEVQGKEENQTRQILFEELKKIRMTHKGSASIEKELEEAKGYLKGRLTQTLETNRDLASYLGQRALFNNLENEAMYFSKIDHVTLEEIHRIATQYIQENRYNLIVLRPYGLIGKLGFLLKQIF